MKTIDYNQSVYELTIHYPEIIAILHELGFDQITKPGMLQTAGRVMTIPKGCRMKGIPFDRVKETMKAHGFMEREGKDNE
ncbi:DUF1858 domain-containing protein [Alkalihalobacterium bogoriense]|uniref:DUF1858 domain-containing protein n=1 Tax=Alkalihalobacterium bogoriense TaxID=246272 RepID=UPI000557378B|nr:DUF1858 domain-containing protein [Alkalihalobacterium bogoriense]